jgi:DNA-binding NtrC family response regulator
MPLRILVADDDPALQAEWIQLVSSLGHEVAVAHSVEDALAELRRKPADLCVCQLGLPGGGASALLASTQDCRPWIPVVAAGGGPVDQMVAALRAGASDFVPRPFHPSAAGEVVKRTLAANWQSAPAARTCSAALMGEHPAMRVVFARVDQIADSGASVLIRGEEGTGKETVARLIHVCGARRSAPFVSMRPATAEMPIEDELFGTSSQTGKMAAAQQGTLFIDEIGDLPRDAQNRLARAMRDQNGKPGVRIVAATTRNLEQAVREGLFLEDLFYRLNVIPIELPALRERPEDIPMLVERFRRTMNARRGHTVPPFSPEVMVRLGAYPWPSNVRQLEYTVDRLVVAAQDRPVWLSDLPVTLRTDVNELGPSLVDLPPHGVDLRLLLTQLEERLIGQALERTGGNKNRAAELLGMNRTTLVEKLRRRNVA